MNHSVQWNMNQYGFNNSRSRMPQRNNYQHLRYQNYTPNFRQWNPNIMDFEQNRYQNNFKPNRGYNRPKHRNKNTNGNNGRRRSFGDGINNRNWILDEECFQEPDNYIPVHHERKLFHRESSLPPPLLRNRIHESRKPEFFENRSLSQQPRTPVKKSKDDYSTSTFKRTIKADHKSEEMLMAWSDSESDSKNTSWVDSDTDKKSLRPEIPKKAITKDEEKLISMIWSDDGSDNEDSLSGAEETSSVSKGRRPFKYSIKSLPHYDGKTVTGDEGMFEIKVFHCTYCNIICLDKEKSKAHMLSKHHYKRYKKEIENYEQYSE